MDYFIVTGGNKLSGEIVISGSKNAALPILFASLLTDEDVMLHNVPRLTDIKTSIALLELGGKKIKLDNSQCQILSSNCSDDKRFSEIPYDLVCKMRASILMAGPILARRKYVKISLPGGCAIGVRPIDIHLDGFKKLGAKILLDGGYVIISASSGLKGNKIELKFPSVGATENLIMAAVIADGITVIENAACEPEISDLCYFLNAMGAKIKGIGSKRIEISGVEKLAGTSYTVIPDRIETATFMIAAAITKGKLVIRNCRPSHCVSVINKLKKSGLDVKIADDTLFVRWSKKLKPVSIKTAVYPGFPTDLQAQWTAFLSTLNGRASITENIFENRFMHVAELHRMGADLKIEGEKVIIRGVKGLSGAPVMVSDLRAGASLVLAALHACGKTKISRIYHLDRGYEHIEKKLSAVGAKIKRYR